MTAPASGSDPTVTRVAMLPLGGRTTIVIELSEPVAHLEHVQPVPTEVVIEGGPVSPRIEARRLEPLGPSPFVLGVSLSPLTRRDGTRHFQVRIKLGAAAVHQLRAVGSRLYVDLSPLGAATAASVNGPPQQVHPLQDGNMRPSTARPESPSKAMRTPKAIISPDEPQLSEQQPHQGEVRPAVVADPQIDTDAAYRELESRTLQHARELAARPDVKRLIRLREDVEKRDTQLGKRQPDLVGRLLDELGRLTDQARGLQLERDRGSFPQKP